MVCRDPLKPFELTPDNTVPRGRPHQICFLHPAYDEGENLLLKLFGFDNLKGGLDYQIAFDACAVVANNRFDGWLATSPHGDKVQSDQCLTLDEYYFMVPFPPTTSDIPLTPTYPATRTHAPSSDHALSLPPDLPTPPPTPYRYPVVPSFRHWRFPHHGLPIHWEALRSSASDDHVTRSGSNAVAVRDNSCRISNHVESCDEAHIVPIKEEDWFNSEEMDRYGEGNREGSAGIHDISNQLLLRCDLHRSWDARQFTFVPKQADGGMRLTTHVFGNSKESRILYHNRLLHQVDVAPEYLFARFAYTILPYIKSFCERGPERSLVIRGEQEPKEVSGSDATPYTKLPNSRNPSPTKNSGPNKRGRGLDDSLETGSAPPTKRICQAEPINWEVHRDEISMEGREMEVIAPVSICQPSVSQATEVVSSPGKAISGTTLNGKDGTHSDVDFVKTLKNQFLLNERARSDPCDSWQKEQDWVRQVQRSKSGIAAEDMPRYLTARGYKVEDEYSDSE